jgi:FemAB-related protein (PEP-CTERM system-associated)
VRQVKVFQSKDHDVAARWDSFVTRSTTGTFFHRSGWQHILHEVFGHDTIFLYVENDGEIEGILPLAHVKSYLFGNAITSLPFAVYGGVVASSDLAAVALEEEAVRIAVARKVEHVEFRNTVQRHPDWPSQELYVTFRKEILPDEEANMLAIPRKQRAMVRKGIKNGLVSSVDRDAKVFFALYADNVHRHGTPALPRRYFDMLMETFGGDCEIQTVYSPEGRALSSVLSFYFRDEILPYYAGDDTSARDLAANDFKYWELMRRACIKGIRVFDYGRSKQGTGSYSFKRNWGFEPIQLHYEYKLLSRSAIPQNNPSNAKYQFLIKTWRRLPIGFANWLGPFVVRNLG